MTTQWIIDTMEEWAPAKWAMESDNVGLIVGDRSRPVSRVLTALDLSEDVLREAVQGRFDFIVTHHPLISRHTMPIKSITADNAIGKKIMTLIANGIGLFSAHTNLDSAPGGVNDLLLNIIGLVDSEPLVEPAESGFPNLGRIGYLQDMMNLADFAGHVARALSMEHIRYVGAADMQVRKIGLCGGNGTSLINIALEKKCDVFITGDISYHLAIDTSEAKMALIDGTHYATEIPIAGAIADYLKKMAVRQGFDIAVQSYTSLRPWSYASRF